MIALEVIAGEATGSIFELDAEFAQARRWFRGKADVIHAPDDNPTRASTPFGAAMACAWKFDPTNFQA